MTSAVTSAVTSAPNLRLHALNRFGMGARPGQSAGAGDPREWLLAQVDAGAPLIPAPSGASDAGAALRALREAQQSSDQAAVMEARRRIAALTSAEMNAALTSRVRSASPFLERLVAFWSNHLCISASAKAVVAPLAGAYEREAIRPHVLGRFEDMVLASAQHPAMLLYLDNAQSIGPSSRAARAVRRPRAGAQRGLNENYARELLELHTLGVDGGYTQRDVQELARILTGWTVNGAGGLRRGADTGGRVRFAFEPLLHDPGSKTVLGARYDEAGVDEGRSAIRALCRHPSTARFVATKLVRHFIADEPPAAAVEAVARTFERSGGDLRATTRTLVERQEAWDLSHRKFRTPQDWLVAVLRALDAPEVAANVPALLRQLRHPLWAPPAPNGFGDTAQQWADPDGLLNRAELARTLGRRLPRRFDPVALLDVVQTDSADTLTRMMGDASIPAQERAALMIASPAFQWR